MPVILAIQEAEIRRIMVRRQSHANSSQDPISKNLTGGVAQVLEHLPSKYEALVQSPL
jgi:hypothetical protein